MDTLSLSFARALFNRGVRQNKSVSVTFGFAA
jgi:hypothetical protein